MVEFDTHGQSDLLVHTKNTSLALTLTCVVASVELELSSLDVPSTLLSIFMMVFMSSSL